MPRRLEVSIGKVWSARGALPLSNHSVRTNDRSFWRRNSPSKVGSIWTTRLLTSSGGKRANSFPRAQYTMASMHSLQDGILLLNHLSEERIAWSWNGMPTVTFDKLVLFCEIEIFNQIYRKDKTRFLAYRDYLVRNTHNYSQRSTWLFSPHE